MVVQLETWTLTSLIQCLWLKRRNVKHRPACCCMAPSSALSALIGCHSQRPRCTLSWPSVSRAASRFCNMLRGLPGSATRDLAKASVRPNPSVSRLKHALCCQEPLQWRTFVGPDQSPSVSADKEFVPPRVQRTSFVGPLF